MQDFLAYTVLGLCLGSVYAIAATGLVVTYSTSGVFNIAHGAVATMSALFYWQLRFDWHAPAPIAIFLTVCVFAPLLGLVLEVVVMRGLRGTSEVTRLVTPVAVLLGINGAATWIWFRSSNRALVPKKFFGESNVKVLGQAVYYHQIIGVLLSIVIAGALYVLLYRTRLGVTMRATVDDRSLLMLNGGRPDRVSMASWAIGASLAGLAGVLLSPQLGALQVFALTLLVFDAYPAAVAGRLRSVPLTYVGAMVLGLSKLYFDWISDAGQRWLVLRNLRNAIPALLLFGALLLLPQDRLRGAIVTRTRERFRVPTMREAVLWGGVLVAAMAMLQSIMSGSAVISLANGVALSLMALSLVLLTGYAGEINLAVFTFAGVAVIAAWQFDVGHAEVLVGGRRVVGNVRVFVGGRPHCVACIATAWLVSRLGHVCLWHHRVPARDLADTAAALQYLWWQVHREPVYKRFAHGAATSLVRHQLCRATRLFDVDDCPLCCARHRYHRHSTQRLWPNDRCDERQPSSVRHPRTQPHAPEARRVYGVICDSRFGWLDVGR